MMLSMDFLISCLSLDVSADPSVFYLQFIRFCPCFTAVGHFSNSLTQFLIVIVYLEGYVNPF